MIARVNGDVLSMNCLDQELTKENAMAGRSRGCIFVAALSFSDKDVVRQKIHKPANEPVDVLSRFQVSGLITIILGFDTE